MDDKTTIESGRNDKGQFVSRQSIMQAASRALGKQAADTAKARAQVDALTGAWKKQEVHIKKIADVQRKAFQTQIKDIQKLEKTMRKSMQSQVKVVQQAMATQVKAYKKLANERVKAMRGSGGGGRGVLGVFGGGKGLGIGGGITGGLGSILGGLSIYAIYRKFMSASTPFLHAELGARGSSAAIRAALQPNVKASAAAELIGRYQSLGKNQLFQSPQAAKGLMRLQSEIAKGSGTEKATELTEELAKSYGDATDSLNAFLQAAGSGNIEQVLKQFASGRNIVETTKALNALGIATDSVKGKNDPMVEANLRLTQTFDTLDAKLEKVITDLTTRLLPALEKITQTIDGMSTNKLLMLGGGIVAAPTALRLGARGLGGLASGVAGGAGLATGGILAGALAVGGGAAYGIDKWRDQQGMGAWGWYQEAQKAKERDKGYEAETNRLKALMAQRKAAQTTTPHKTWWDTIKEGAQSALAAAHKYGEKIREIQSADKVAKLQALAARQQQAGLNVQVAGSGTELARARLDLARTNFFGPQMGMMASIPEFKALQDTIKNEIGKLQEQLATVDQTDEQGKIEAAKLNTQILGLRKESKQGVIDLLQGLNPLDAIAAQALGSGKYERFLTTKERNLGKGLRAGEVRNNPLVGSINRGGALATPFRYSTNMGTSVSDLNRYSNQLNGLIPPQINALMPQSQLQQDLAGGAMMRPETESGVGIQPVNTSSKKVDQLKEILGGLQQLIRIEESDVQGGSHSGRVSSQTSY